MAVDAQMVLDYLAEEHYLEMDGVDGDTPLFTSGRVDSFSMVDIMTFVENAIGKRMNPADFTVDNMDTANRIAGYVNGIAA